MEKHEMLKNLTMLDFFSLDLALYLNTHPTDKKAIAKYNETVANAEKARAAYEHKYGPLCSFRSSSGETWSWIDDPWPWCYDSNFEFCGEEI